MSLVTQSITRGMRVALAQAGISLVWASPAGAVPFKAIKNSVEPQKDGVDKNAGDDTACTLDALAVDLGAAMPGQGDEFTEAATSLSYRVSAREWVPGNPVIRFVCPNVVASA